VRHIVKIVLLVTSPLALAVVLSGCSSGENEVSTTVAATVNGRNIMLREVEQLINQQMAGKQTQLTTLQMAQARLQVLDSLIQKEVLVQRAEKENLKVTEDEITQYISAAKRDRGMTEEQFQRQLQAENQTLEGFREDTRKLLAIQKLQAKYTGSISISDREVEEYYLANKEAFTIGRGVELAAIVVDPRDNGPQDDTKNEGEAKLKIDNIYQQLKNADFAEVARAKSEDPNSNMRGGDVGFATEDQLKENGFPAPLIAQFFGPMEVGSYSAPVEFNGKWYIFKLKRKQLAAENRTLESAGVRPEITEVLRGQRQQVLNGALLEVAMNEAKIVNHLATNMLNNPANLGLRPAAEGSAPAQSTQAPTQAPTQQPSPAASTSTSSPVTVKPAASPK
jgi:peptidyl-prolyl cis-trans isomerase SurA